MEDESPPQVKLEEIVSEDVIPSEVPKRKTLLERIRTHPDTGLAIVTFGLYVDFLLLLTCTPILPLFGSALHIGELGLFL